MNHLLPTASLVSFDAYRAAHARAVWRQQVSGIILEDYAYFIPLPGDRGDACLPGARTFLAERYGGAGLGFNGGGARCGLRSGVQVKGIGRNCLAGSATGFWHSYGGETLANGIREAIWSEVLQMALPYGAARVHGVLDTATRVPAFAANDVDSSVRRGLTIREAVLRPAHFMRSVYFSRDDIRAHGLAPDAERTAAAIGMLAAAFRHLRLAPSTGHAPDLLAASLHELFHRFGTQSAAALAKRIVHGTLNASNLCLDGRWIDFGTITTISDYGRIATGKSGEDIWNHSRIEKIAVDWVFYLKRFLPPAIGATIPMGAELYQTFLTTLEARLELEFLKLTGLPEQALQLTTPQLRAQLYRCMRRIILSGNREPFKLFQPCAAQATEMPPRMGDFHINSMMTCAALAQDEAGTDIALRAEIANDALRHQFIEAYWALRRACLAATRQWEAAPTLFIAVNAIRVNCALPDLYRHALDADIERRVAAGECMQRYVDAMVLRGQTVLADPRDGGVRLNGWSRARAEGDLTLSSEHGPRLGDNRLPATVLIDLLADDAITPPQKERLVALCKTAP